MIDVNSEIVIARAVIKALHAPYVWGADGPDQFDCSGFFGYVYRELGLLPPGYDDTAQGYYNRYKDSVVETPTLGCGVVYGKSKSKVTHIMLCVNSRACVGAVRGNKWVDTPEKAVARRARVDIREIYYRKDDFIVMFDPFKKEES